MQKIKAALISVFNKDGLSPIIEELHKNGVQLYSTGGTEKFIRAMEIPVHAVENLTGYPSILGGRVKTLHPKVFGGILNRRANTTDQEEIANFDIPQMDLVIVDLYPFEATVAAGGTQEEIIEKIDIGGIALIRAAAKNFKDVLCVAHKDDYGALLELLSHQESASTVAQRQEFASKAFHVSSHYDTAIFNYFNRSSSYLKLSEASSKTLRYGENPHQKGQFFGRLEDLLVQLHGKELSYNNLLDVDAAVQLILEFKDEPPTFAILKHNNTCGIATRDSLATAYKDALSGDPVSAFGGVLISNTSIDTATATAIHELFCEVVIAPDFEPEALAILKQKKNRILLEQKEHALPDKNLRSCLNGVLVQEKDTTTDQAGGLKTVTKMEPSEIEIEDLLFASKICKHTKSNTIVLAKNKQLLASGTGQTSRVDALEQAIEKARKFNFDLTDAVMASDAFFPFPDCVSIAHKAGINTVIQPGGSIKDQDSINYCDENKMKMVVTGVRHFKH